MKRWSCHRCGKAFIHARMLVSHLMTMHAEGTER